MKTKEKFEEKGIVKVDTKIIESKVESAVAQAKSVVIKTDEDQANAAKIITNVKLLQKFLKQEKDKLLKPALETTKAIRGLFAPMEEKVDEAERVLRIGMGAYHDKKEAEIAKKQESVVKRVESGQLKEETGLRKLDEIGEVKSNVKSEEGMVKFTKVKAIRITNKDLVPDEYWELNMVMVRREALNADKLGKTIPGVEVYEETSVATNV